MDQAGFRQLSDRLLKIEIVRIAPSENKIGKVRVGEGKIHFPKHIQDHKFILHILLCHKRSASFQQENFSTHILPFPMGDVKTCA